MTFANAAKCERCLRLFVSTTRDYTETLIKMRNAIRPFGDNFSFERPVKYFKMPLAQDVPANDCFFRFQAQLESMLWMQR
ncbi:Hypothetical predicted protein [Podarcis lilfordi]|uniref:Uncharacterized protein n=1 Tax=Podarcis lilfordi TaxID=74358 RepID=A0AA35K1Z9_9SAUR|nr:Hypothetical predicted protein [Podarcis lilfordi]